MPEPLAIPAIRTFRLTTVIGWIVFAAHTYSTAYTAMGAESFITSLTQGLPGGKWGALIFMMVVLFLLGMVLDPVGIMLITLPVFLPLMESHQYVPEGMDQKIWFGILFVGRFEANSIVFPSQGYAFAEPDVQQLLEPAGFMVPRPKAAEDVH